jgi:integrase
MDERLRYFVKRLAGSRKGFTLVAYVMDGRKRVYQPLPEKAKTDVAAINKQLKKEIVTEEQARLLLGELIERLYRKAKVRDRVIRKIALSDVNDKLFAQFWEEVYGVRFLDEPAATEYKIRKALSFIEPLNLATASARELQATLQKNARTLSRIRYATDRLNQLLKYLGRDFRLNKPKARREPVSHLSLADFKRVLPHFRDPVAADLATVLFASGIRLGEALALEPGAFNGGKLNVHENLTRGDERREPKSGSDGKPVVLEFGHNAVRRWLRFDGDKAIYHHKLYDELLRACAQAFPNDTKKHISPHDLRHSHAIHLLAQGASLTQVALNLRNTVAVCQRFYTGFVHSDESAEALKRLLAKS